jgi:hypothetical protein
MYYLKAILQRIISTIVFVCVRPINRSELLYRSQTTLQQKGTGSCTCKQETCVSTDIIKQSRLSDWHLVSLWRYFRIPGRTSANAA